MWADALLLSGACLVAAFCAGLAGFAFVLVGAALLLHVMPPALTAPVLVIGSLIVQGIASWQLRRDIAWGRLRLHVIAATLGLPLGLAALTLGPARWIIAFVGVLLVVYAGYTLARIALRIAPPPLPAGPRADAVVAFASGILGGIGGYVGALVGMWADATGASPGATRALLQPFIAIMQALTILGLALTGFFTREALWLTVSALPALLLGTWLGIRAYGIIPAQGFRLVLLSLLLLSGLSLLA
jgi:uncharacterized membrane protein YfcA